LWFDSHCHLHLVEESRPLDEVLAGARLAGVTELVTVGIDVNSSERAVELADETGVWACVGIHPSSADQLTSDARATLEAVVKKDRVVAVGETGLDFYREHADPQDQGRAFRAHIELAKAWDKALVIHTRASVDEALGQLWQEGPPERLVFHCWSGDEDQLLKALELGAFISFAGNISFKNAPNLRALAREVPSERLLVETDAPFLAPVPFRGRPNAPEHLPLVGASVAQARSQDIETVAARTTENARRLFGIN
jgi:TatD DNase family protein